jgi:hypothetical protein
MVSVSDPAMTSRVPLALETGGATAGHFPADPLDPISCWFLISSVLGSIPSAGST